MVGITPYFIVAISVPPRDQEPDQFLQFILKRLVFREGLAFESTITAYRWV
jgi:hypothetical protein